jgi:hypothetical protein
MGEKEGVVVTTGGTTGGLVPFNVRTFKSASIKKRTSIAEQSDAQMYDASRHPDDEASYCGGEYCHTP